MNLFLLFGSILMFIGVGLGAFGAHSFAEFLAAAGREGTFETAVRYQVYHALALLVVGILNSQSASPLLSWGGWLFFVGTLVFSGSLYILIYSGVKWLGAITPIGGVLFLAGWACLVIYAIKHA
ncbi:MAG: uncharacterized membrane protein YgdD (TMEM256/DUF423 family) [Cellvibrionaceae bacterium]|jgi:uncharacterized membrane protein YgdD (TMEM256/DUF423 family)